jgi:YidC/Oxa1 family membrane protein insertase
VTAVIRGLLAENSIVHQIGAIFQPLLKLVADVLAFFFAVVPNYPVDVALLTIVIMALLTPLTVKSTKNMAAMQALSPEMKKLQQKYKGAENRTQLNEEMMKLYKEHNVNPASGCLPMLLQFPAFIILYNVIRGITNTVTIPVTKVVNGHKVSLPPIVKAEPRYLSHSSKMYQDIVAAHGQLNSFGMNFADKLLSHHSSLWVGIPYLVLVLGAVALQYLQMARLNARNPQANQANPQAAMMQKYLPLIFGLIYLNVAAILNVYFIFSSAIRIATQEVLFRRGIVAGPPAPSAGVKPAAKGSHGGKPQGEKALPRPGGSSAARPKAVERAAANGNADKADKVDKVDKVDNKAADVVEASATENGRSAAKTNGSGGGGTANGKRPAQGSRPRSGGGRPTSQNRTRSAGSAAGDAEDEKAEKPHPRSKAKRARKAR